MHKVSRKRSERWKEDMSSGGGGMPETVIERSGEARTSDKRELLKYREI